MLKSLALSMIFVLTGLNQFDFELVKQYDVKAEYFTSDQFQNIYLVNKSELKKIDKQTNETISFSNNLFGHISSVDVSDPFRILIFNQDFNKITFLDNTLSEITSPLILDELGYYNVKAVCQSNNGGFWLFDQSLYQLIYIDKSLKVSKTSAEIGSLIHNPGGEKNVFLLEKNDYIYLGIPGEGILQFDTYGTYIKTFPIANGGRFQIKNELVIYSNTKQVVLYDLSNFEVKSIDLPVDEILSARIEGNTLYVHTIKGLKLFTSSSLNR